MKPTLDDSFVTDITSPRATPAASNRDDLPAYERPRRTLPPMVVAAAMFLSTGAAFYSAEMFAAVDWKPSHIMGSYERAMAEARKSGELTAQIRYEGQLKQIETAAVQWQEQYKAAATGVVNSYQAVYQRAGIFAQATADIQKQYAATRYQLAANGVSGELGVANMATMLGAIGSLFDPSIEQSANAYADEMRNRAYAKLDEAAKSGVTISVDG